MAVRCHDRRLLAARVLDVRVAGGGDSLLSVGRSLSVACRSSLASLVCLTVLCAVGVEERRGVCAAAYVCGPPSASLAGGWRWSAS